jgi:hypothetical protein
MFINKETEGQNTYRMLERLIFECGGVTWTLEVKIKKIIVT